MLTNIQAIFITVVVYNFWIIAVLYIITHIVYTAYHYANRTDAWWLCLLPFGRMYCDYQMVGQPWWLNLLYVVSAIFACTVHPVLILPWLVVSTLYAYKFANVNVDYPKYFTYFVPYRLYWYALEAYYLLEVTDDG